MTHMEETNAEDAWADEIARRIAKLDAGRAKIVDAKGAIAAARQELDRRRGDGHTWLPRR